MAYNKETGLYEGYIYKIINTTNGKVYIGQTTTTVEHRMSQHFSNSRKKSSRILKNAIEKYGKDAFLFDTLFIIKDIGKKELCIKLNDLEIKTIKEYNSITPNGYNISKGGNNHDFLSKSVDVYDKDGVLIKTFDSCVEAGIFANVSNTVVRNMCKGDQLRSNQTDYIFRYTGDDFYKYDQFTYKHQYKIYQYTKDGEFVRKYNNAQEVSEYYDYIKPQGVTSAVNRNGFYHNYYWSKNDIFDFDINKYQRYHPVDQYDLDGNLVKQWNSIMEATEYLNINCPSSIYKQTIGKISVPVCGYVWRDRGHSFNEYYIDYNVRKRIQPVDQYTLDGVLINRFSSIKEAGEYNNISPDYYSHISACCKGKKGYALGYVWRYKDEPYEKYKVNTKFHTKISVDKYDKNGNYLASYSTITEALKYCGKTNDYVSHISKVCKYEKKSAFGYVWRYHGEPFFIDDDPNQPDKSKIIQNIS